MSADEQSGAGRREVAYRVFAAEYDDADFQYTENEADERAPNYVVTPTGARVNRLFLVGVLTEVERVNDEMLRGRIVDPTGAFVVYAGQYQPDALTALERLEPPAFVAVTGKARTFQPEDGDTIYTSVRPESINEVDADTRDRWTVGAARHTVERVATFADALEREERGEDLTAALEADGVDHGFAAGIPLAIDHYGTTPAYLEAIRERAIEAAEVVAGEREEVAPLDLAPDEGGSAGADLGADAGIAGVDASETSGGAATSDSGDAATPDASAAGESADAGANGASDETDEPETAVGSGDAPVDEPDVEVDGPGADTDEPDADADEPGADTDEPDADADELDADADEPAAATDEMYELDEDEREEIESEYGTDFSTGADIEEPGESDLEAPEPETTDTEADATPDGAPDESPEPEEGGEETPEDVEEEAPGEESEEPESADEPAADVDLEEAVVEAMRDLDSGDGADREAVIERVSEEHGADSADVEDAVQDALMSGTCYEPGDGLLKAI